MLKDGGDGLGMMRALRTMETGSLAWDIDLH